MTYLVKKSNLLDVFDTLFDSNQEAPISNIFKDRLGFLALAVNVKSDENQVTITTELPGLDKKDVKVDYEKGYITIQAEKKEELVSEKEQEVVREISSGTLKRRVYVGDINFEKSTASLNNGVLKLTLPKSEAQKPKTLKIN